MTKKDLILLELLSSDDRPWYGPELLAASGELRRATLFIYLNRLAEKQLIFVEKVIERSRRKIISVRRTYRITDKGRHVLETLHSETYA